MMKALLTAVAVAMASSTRALDTAARLNADGSAAPPAAPSFPFWTATTPDPAKPLQGFKKISGRADHGVFLPEHEHDGMYNHAAMIVYHDGVITISWKNAPLTEDTPGQRVLFSQSTDGQAWSKAAVLFPNMSTTANPAAQFAGPFAVINGRLYATATPAVIADGDAQGGQWCLWPDGLDPRNCATPDRPGTQPTGLLQMRQLLPGGTGALGDPFWVSPHPPAVFRPAAAAIGIKGIAEMDATTQADVQQLVGNGTTARFEPPCDTGYGSGTLKCEGCVGGCQLYESAGTKGHGIANERAHYTVPRTGEDVILFRSHAGTLAASVRRTGWKDQADWSVVANTTIPNDNSNLNAGMLPDRKGAFLVSNVAPSKTRDPLMVSFSADGWNFSTSVVVQTCTDIQIPGSKLRSRCKARQKANKNVGPSYPQGLSVVAPAPAALVGLWVVATNNKEDVVATHVGWDDVYKVIEAPAGAGATAPVAVPPPTDRAGFFVAAETVGSVPAQKGEMPLAMVMPASTQLYGKGSAPVDMAAAAAKLIAELDPDNGIYHANTTLWTSTASSFHLFATNRTEACHYHPGTTFAQTLSGTGAFRTPYGTPAVQNTGDSFFIPEGAIHAFGPAAGTVGPVVVSVLWSPPYHDRYTIPADGCRMA